MKKISLLLVVLLAAGSASLYGQMMVGTDFSISGDAKATAGYDLDKEAFGFKNEANANIKFEVVAKNSSDNGMMGEDGWVGAIYLKDFKIIIDSGDEDSTDLRYLAAECKDDSDDGWHQEESDPPEDCSDDGKEWDKTFAVRLIVHGTHHFRQAEERPAVLADLRCAWKRGHLVARGRERRQRPRAIRRPYRRERRPVDNDVGVDLGRRRVSPWDTTAATL